MEKSDSKTSQKQGSGDDRDDQRDDEQPTTSRGDAFSPEQISHNMNDLKAMDFNSADEIRQAMKLILSGKVPPQPFSEQAKQISLPILKVKSNPEPMMVNELVQQQAVHHHDGYRAVQGHLQHSMYHKISSASRAWAGKPSKLGSSRQQRSGRPPKAGPSKQIKKTKVSSMYIGKLSNVVPFRRRWESDSESDVESVVLFY